VEALRSREVRTAFTYKKSKSIPITGHGGLEGCETLRIPQGLDSQPTDGDKVISPLRIPQGLDSQPTDDDKVISLLRIPQGVDSQPTDGDKVISLLRIPQGVDRQPTDGDKVISLTRLPTLYSPETIFFSFWYSYLLEDE
jgi:hypothetical protein